LIAAVEAVELVELSPEIGRPEDGGCIDHDRLLQSWRSGHKAARDFPKANKLARLMHNAGFHIALLNAELKRAGGRLIATERVVDTLVLARRKHAGGLRLDDLCARYGVDRSRRSKHGALLDAELLAAVYVELTTTRQAALQLELITRAPSNIQAIVRPRPTPLQARVTAEDRAAHRAFMATLGSAAIWLDCYTPGRNAAT
jgi:DNA polymerase III subunit epsilon